jgi:acetamidase/formamidase
MSSESESMKYDHPHHAQTDGCDVHTHRLSTAVLPPVPPQDTLLHDEHVSQTDVQHAIERRSISRFGFARVASAGLLFGAAATVPAAAQTGKPVFSTKDIGKRHVLESTKETVAVGSMDPARASVLTIDSGDLVSYPNTWINWGNEAKYGMSYAQREPIRLRYPQGPYSMPGPVAIRGAEPGDVVECRMIRLKPIYWGWNSAPNGVGALPADFKVQAPYLHYLKFDDARTKTDFGNGVTIALNPLQGVMSLQPAGDKPVSAILSGAYGGNIVLRELVEGTSLFLPVQVSGAKVWTGDSHAAQGDGVVDQTAIETAMDDLQIQYVLHKKRPLLMPVAETPTHWITLGYGDILDDSITNALRSAIDWISASTKLSKQDVYALYSIIGSFRVTQYAHQTGTVYSAVPTKTVHGMLPKSAFDSQAAAAISAYWRTNS